MKGWKFDWTSCAIGFVAGLMLMFIAGTIRPPA